MEQLEQSQTMMNEEIDSINSKMDHILELMMAQNRREEECRVSMPIRTVKGHPYTLPKVPTPNPMIWAMLVDFTSQIDWATGQPSMVRIIAIADGDNVSV